MVARSAFIALGPGETRVVQVTLDAPQGEYVARQATDVGSNIHNIHEDLVTIDVSTFQHGAS